jgi:hypothetical protein
MRYMLSVDFEDDAEIESFLEFVKFHSARLKCEKKDVFVKLAVEWKSSLRITRVVEVEKPKPKPVRRKSVESGT